MTCTENYENWLRLVKVMPKILAVVSFCNFYEFVFPNSQGSAATQLRCGGKYNVLCWKFHAFTSSKNIVKICLDLTKF